MFELESDNWNVDVPRMNRKGDQWDANVQKTSSPTKRNPRRTNDDLTKHGMHTLQNKACCSTKKSPSPGRWKRSLTISIPCSPFPSTDLLRPDRSPEYSSDDEEPDGSGEATQVWKGASGLSDVAEKKEKPALTPAVSKRL